MLLWKHPYRIGSDDGLLPVRRQAITCTSDEFLWNGPLGTNWSEICTHEN